LTAISKDGQFPGISPPKAPVPLCLDPIGQVIMQGKPATTAIDLECRQPFLGNE
jgi:hypothetical protein